MLKYNKINYNNKKTISKQKNMYRDTQITNTRSNCYLNLNIYQPKNNNSSFNQHHHPIYSNINRRNLYSGKIVKNKICYNGNSHSDLIHSGSNKNSQNSYNRLNSKNTHDNRLKSTGKSAVKSISRFSAVDISNPTNLQQNKYRAMLAQYNDRKQLINSQITHLKQTSSLNPQKPPLKQTTNYYHQPPTNQSQQKYETLNEQLLALQTKIKKKQKITQIYPIFFNALQKQILLQQQLRNIKKYILPQHKVIILSKIQSNPQILSKISIQLNPQQYDPFQITSSTTMTIQQIYHNLIKKYQQCQQNWKQKVCKLTKHESMQIFFAFNFEKVEQISLKSFVRQLNYLLHKQLRIRQLFAIYNRFNPFTQTNFCSLTSQKS